MKLHSLLCTICLAAVLGTTSASAQGDVSYTLSWDPISDINVTHVLVYRSTTSGSGYIQIAELDVSETEYTDTGLEYGVRYYYSLRSRSNTGSLSAFSLEVSGLTVDADSPAWMNQLCQIVDSRTVADGVEELDWTTDTPSTGFVRYKRLGDPDFQESAVDDVLRQNHTTTLGGLELLRDYVARAVAYNSTGRSMTVSKDFNFDTYPGTDDFELVTDVDTLTVPEGGTASFDVRLSDQPSGTIEVSVSHFAGDGDISVSAGATLSFSTTNWDVFQTVTLAAAEDVDWDNGQASILVEVTSGPSVPSRYIVALEADDDTPPAPEFVTQPDTLIVAEGGTATFGVRLSAPPSDAVEVAVAHASGDGDIWVSSGGTLSFSPSNWNNVQPVTLTADEDADTQSGRATFLIYVTSGPPVSSTNVVAFEADNDSPATPVLVTQTDTLTVAEGGSATFGVRLSAEPGGAIEVAVTHVGGDTDISVTGGAALSFSPSNWNVFQPVTVAAAEDPDNLNGQATVLVYVTSGATMPFKNVIVREVDDDPAPMPQIVVSATRIEVPEGGTAEFDVRLSLQPVDTVVVALERAGGDGDISVLSDPTLRFSPGDWAIDRTVVLACAEDSDSEDGVATIRVYSETHPGISEVLVSAVESDNGPEMVAAQPVTVYPVPFRPGQSVLTIDNGVAGGSLEIYDLRGRVIWSKPFGGGTHLEWDGSNTNATTVASGRYFILVKDADNSVLEKKTILVVR